MSVHTVPEWEECPACSKELEVTKRGPLNIVTCKDESCFFGHWYYDESYEDWFYPKESNKEQPNDNNESK